MAGDFVEAVGKLGACEHVELSHWGLLMKAAKTQESISFQGYLKYLF